MTDELQFCTAGEIAERCKALKEKERQKKEQKKDLTNGTAADFIVDTEAKPEVDNSFESMLKKMQKNSDDMLERYCELEKNYEALKRDHEKYHKWLSRATDNQLDMLDEIAKLKKENKKLIEVLKDK